jgi:hypothetical protein
MVLRLFFVNHPVNRENIDKQTDNTLRQTNMQKDSQAARQTVRQNGKHAQGCWRWHSLIVRIAKHSPVTVCGVEKVLSGAKKGYLDFKFKHPLWTSLIVSWEQTGTGLKQSMDEVRGEKTRIDQENKQKGATLNHARGVAWGTIIWFTHGLLCILFSYSFLGFGRRTPHSNCRRLCEPLLLVLSDQVRQAILSDA